VCPATAGFTNASRHDSILSILFIPVHSRRKYARQNQKSPIFVHSLSNSTPKFPTRTAHHGDKTPDFCRGKSIFKIATKMQHHARQTFTNISTKTSVDKTLPYSVFFIFCPTTIRPLMTLSCPLIRRNPRYPRLRNISAVAAPLRENPSFRTSAFTPCRASSFVEQECSPT
jgi:hypothetical protein